MRVLQITAYSGWGCTGRIAVGIHNALINQNQECAIAWGRVNTADGARNNFYVHIKVTDHSEYNRKLLCVFLTKICTVYIHVLLINVALALEQQQENS